MISLLFCDFRRRIFISVELCGKSLTVQKGSQTLETIYSNMFAIIIYPKYKDVRIF
jgi:hypothetical protein